MDRAPDEQPTADYKVGEGYFTTIGIPLIAGREFTRADDENAPLVAIVNESMAAKYWPGKGPDWSAASDEGSMDAGGRALQKIRTTTPNSKAAEVIFLYADAPEFFWRSALVIIRERTESRRDPDGIGARSSTRWIRTSRH